MPADPAPDRTGVRPGSILVVVLVYAVFATLWILLSDKAVEWLFSDPVKITLASSIKGGLFVAITSALLYRLMRRRFGTSAAVTPTTPGLRHLGLPFALLAAAIFVLAASGISYTFSQQRDNEVARLQAIADLRAHQITDWLTERLEDAEFVRGSQPLATDYRRWRETGDNASRDRLQTLLAQWSQNRDFAAIMLLDAQGTRLLGSPLAPANIAPLLQDAARQTVADQRTRLAGPYRDRGGRLRLDFLALLAPAGVPPALVVLETDPNSWLYRTLQDWPTPSASGETLIFRRDGDQVLFLSELRHLRESAVKKRIPVATAGLLAAQVLRGETGTGRRIEGEDYRRVAVLGVAQAIPGTDWFLIAKMDRAELYGEASQQAIWIALSGMLALLTAGAGFYLLRQRQQFAIAIGLRQSQEARLRTLHLLTAITDSSDDAIFAKDLSGRYILFNRAASRFVGKPAEAVLGQDDHALFPTDQAEMLMAGDRQALSENRSLTREERLDTPTGERVFLATKGPLLNVDGMAIGSFGISRDITERNRAEQALRESEVTYRSLFENIMNSVVHARVVFQDGRPVDLEYLSANPAFATVTGITEPVVGRRISEVIPGYRENNPESIEIFGQVATTGIPRRWEHYLAELERWFSFMIYSPARGEVVIVTENITERKQAETALRDSEGRFRALVEQTLAGIYIIQDDRFTYANPGLARVFGYGSAEELIDRVPVADLISPEDRARVAENVRRRVEGEVTDVHYTFTGLRRDGSRFDVEVHGRGFNYRGRPAVIGFLLDITDRKAAEANLRLRNEELERFNRAGVGRELDMIELKREINALSRRLGQPPPYSLDFLDQADTPNPEGTS